jgi:microcin C transport system substrate-binding protein
MALSISRRTALKAAAAGLTASLCGAGLRARADERAEEGEIETYGLSAFGDLALPADFKHFAYVNPDAPKGGLLSVQITSTTGNQNFDTFDTLNI